MERKKLIVWASANDFFACWSQKDGMFKLSCVAALNVAEGWVGIDNSFVTQVFESHQVFRLIQTI